MYAIVPLNVKATSLKYCQLSSDHVKEQSKRELQVPKDERMYNKGWMGRALHSTRAQSNRKFCTSLRQKDILQILFLEKKVLSLSLKSR